MSSPPTRLRSILGHLSPFSSSSPAAAAGHNDPKTHDHAHHLHTLSPTFFLERAIAIEPDAEAVVHVAANGRPVRRTYAEFGARARGFAYFLRRHGLHRVGILAPNTPAFLETIYGVGAAGGALVPVNYRLKEDDIGYIFEFAEVDSIVVDREFEALLEPFRKAHSRVKIIVDWVSLPPLMRACRGADGAARRTRTRPRARLRRRCGRAWRTTTRRAPRAGTGCMPRPPTRTA